MPTWAGTISAVITLLSESWPDEHRGDCSAVQDLTHGLRDPAYCSDVDSGHLCFCGRS